MSGLPYSTESGGGGALPRCLPPHCNPIPAGARRYPSTQERRELAAFEQLFNQYQTPIYNYIHRLMGS